MRNKRIVTNIIILFTASPFISLAQENGIAIAKEADKRDNGWGSVSMSFSMTLKNKSGQETVRKLHSYMLEVEDDGDKSLVVFDNPSDVKGTASLVHSHKQGDDDQWLYLPALKQVKRISSSNKSGPFMGSEFAYEDVSSQELEKFTYKYIGLSKVSEGECYLIERYPLDKNSGYKRQQVWFNKTNYRIEKIDYYDRKDVLIKTLTYSSYKLYQQKFWRPDEMTMYNHQTGKQTITRFSSYQFNVGLSKDDFTQNSLQNAK
jgi:outer membrane lipoprotein-sorting protein